MRRATLESYLRHNNTIFIVETIKIAGIFTW